MEYVTKSGEPVPAVGVGTWQMNSDTAYNSVSMALEEGYRHVDTAQLYKNEGAVGRAITDADVGREELFITTKVNPRHRQTPAIVESVKQSVEKLGVDTVDLLLIHWPHPLADNEIVINALNQCFDEGLTRFIGVSNYNVERLDHARRISNEPIFTNQVLFHPWWPQRDLLRYCQQNDILLTGYSPLANGGALKDSVLREIGENYGKTPAQVAIRWAIQHENVITIPMSTSRAHLADNIDIFDFLLTQDEHDRITRPSYLRTGLAMVRGQFGI